MRILLDARQVLIKEPDIGGEEVRRSSLVNVKAVEAIEVPNSLDAWEVAEGLSPMQTYRPHIFYLLSTYLVVTELFRKERNIPASR